MDRDTFTNHLNDIRRASLGTLLDKNTRYSTDEDLLYNFRMGAKIAGGTSCQCAWGYMTKHLVALQKMILDNDFYDRDELLEKCQDIINYTCFIYILGMEESEKYVRCNVGREQTSTSGDPNNVIN